MTTHELGQPKKPQTLAGRRPIASPLTPHPFGWVVIPVVAGVGDSAERCFEVVPSPLVVETPPNQLSDEDASFSATGTPVDLGHQIVVQGDVQPHRSNLAQAGFGPNAVGRS